VTNNEKCKEPAGFGGMNIYDVSNPASRTVLAQGFGDDQANNDKQSAHQTHSVFAWQDGAKAYAVMVDNEESADIDIVDITNPRKPRIVAEYDLAKDAPEILQPGKDLDEVFLHDMVVKEIDGRQIMLASYWDGGYVKLDVTSGANGIPPKPVVLADSDFAPVDPEGMESGLLLPDGTTPVPPEGNAHQAEFTKDNAFVLGADEDFSPFATVARNVSDDTDLTVGSGSDTKQLEPGDEITGQAVFGGRACPGDAAVPAGEGLQIAVVERGVCTFTEKVAAIEKAGGYVAAVIFNRTASDGCNNALGMSVEGGIPAFGVAPRGQGFAIFGATYDDTACKAGDGTQVSGIPLGAKGDTLNFGSYFDGWGYVRLLDGTTLAEHDTYAVDQAHQQGFAEGAGDLSVHEVAMSAVDSRVAFVSYYAAGVRAVRITDDRKIQEIGALIDDGGNNFWGVEVFQQGGQEYAALSDRDFGLYIVKLGDTP
jgi:hypothetical protein